MSLIDESMTGTALVPLPYSVEILAPALAANPHLTDHSSIDWLTATVTTTVLGDRQPASTKALERATRVGMQGVYEFVLEPVPVTPLGRLRVGSTQYSVLDVRAFGPFTHVIAEEVAV